MSFLRIFAVGAVVGGLYALAGIKSSAPPLIALVGLAGMVVAGALL